MLQFHALEPRARPPVVTPVPGKHTETLIAAGDATYLIMTRTMTADQLRTLYALDPVYCRTEAWRKVKITCTVKGKVLLASQPVRSVAQVVQHSLSLIFDVLGPTREKRLAENTLFLPLSYHDGSQLQWCMPEKRLELWIVYIRNVK